LGISSAEQYCGWLISACIENKGVALKIAF